MRRTPALLAAAAAATALLAAPASAGEAAIVARPKIFATSIPKVKAKAEMDVFLPSRLRVFTAARRVKGKATSTSGGYDLTLGVGSHCNGANVCLLADFSAFRGGKPSGRRVALTG